MGTNSPRLILCLWLGVVGSVGLDAAEFSREAAYIDVVQRYPAATQTDDRRPESVLAREAIVYAEADDVPLRLDVYSEKHDEPRPAVLIVHGGGWETGTREMERPLAYALAKRGLVAIPVSYRLGPKGRFPNALHDLKGAVRFIRAHAADYGIDSERIAIAGGSAGGQLALLLGATNDQKEYEGNVGVLGASSRVNAVIDIDGLADFTDPSLLEQQNAKPSAPTRFLGGPFAERAEIWRAASPVFHITKRSAPVLFINSTAPTPLLPGRDRAAETLRGVGVQAETITISNTPHPFWLYEPWFSQVVAEITRFLLGPRSPQ